MSSNDPADLAPKRRRFRFDFVIESMDRDPATGSLRVAMRPEACTLDAVLRRLGREPSQEFLRLVEAVWSPAVEDVVRRAAYLNSHDSPGWAAVGLLLRRGDSEVWASATSWTAEGTGEEASRQRAVQAAGVTFRADPRRAWPAIWSVFSDPATGLAIMKELVGMPGAHNASGWNELTPQELADLYIWLHRHALARPGRDELTGGTFTPADGVQWFRDGLVGRIRDRATDEAVRAIKSIAAAVPDWWMGFMPYEAAQAKLEASSRHLEPSEVTRMLAHSKSRYVESRQDLVAVVVDILDEYEVWLHRHLGAVVDIWNEDSTPVSETKFSAHVARYLRDRLEEKSVVVNREVVVRERRADQPGERVDILVQVPRRHEHPALSVVIEVKGCWNSAVHTAMRSQLLDRYMADEPGAAGVYLVGYFGPAPACGTRCGLSDFVSDCAALRSQALELSKDRTVIEAVVIDTRLSRK